MEMPVWSAKSTTWISVSEVAEQCGVAPNTVRNWITVGLRPGRIDKPIKLQAASIGGRFVVKRRWLKEFLAATQLGTTEGDVKAEGGGG